MPNMAIPRLQKALGDIVGPGHVSAGKAVSTVYAYDASLASGQPSLVVFPADTDQTAKVVNCLFEAGVAFVPRGFGTNLSGGTIIDNGVVVSLARLNRILAIEPENRIAVVQPGVTNLELQNALMPHGFFYAPDPASQKVATIGGNIGENSGGPRCLKYGVTTNHILGVQLVLADGETVRLGGSAIDPPGLDLRGVVVGSEGTFGLVTEAMVRILPLPEKIVTLLASYERVTDAARSVAAVIADGILPLTLEMMDAPVIEAVEKSLACGYPVDAAAVLLIEIEGPADTLDQQAEQIGNICRKLGCRDISRAKNEAERNRLWEGRRGALGAVARLAPNYLLNDCTVPRTKLPEALNEVARISQKYGFAYGNVFHAGDGNLHPLLFFDSRNAIQLDKVKKAGWEIMAACVKLGGTISGEHGIGREKIEAMGLIFSADALACQRSLKKAFDPDNRLNPHKIIPDLEDLSQTARTHPLAAEKKIMAQIEKAAAQGTKLVICGKGIQQASKDNGTNAIRLESAALNDLIEVDPANQIATAQAGMTLAELQKQLAPKGLWLPLRPFPNLGRHSLGGIVATGACGPERILYGAPRDLILGLRFIDGRGRLIEAGGRVLKNVAGYDLTRLLTGSAGSLGFISQATFKLATRPQICTALKIRGKLDSLAQAAAGMLRSGIGPAFVAAAETAGGDLELAAGFEGLPQTTALNIEKLKTDLKRYGLTRTVCEPYPVLDGYFKQIVTPLFSADFVVKIDLPLSRTGPFCKVLNQKGAIPKWRLIDFGCGRIWLGLQSEKSLADIEKAANLLKGHLQLPKAPPGFNRKSHLSLSAVHKKLSQRIKKALDPESLWSNLPGTG